MDFRSLVRLYQTYDQRHGTFDMARNDSQYASLLGISRDRLSFFYSGRTKDSWVIFRAFVRTFPHARDQAIEAVAGEPVSDTAGVA